MADVQIQENRLDDKSGRPGCFQGTMGIYKALRLIRFTVQDWYLNSCMAINTLYLEVVLSWYAKVMPDF